MFFIREGLSINQSVIERAPMFSNKKKKVQPPGPFLAWKKTSISPFEVKGLTSHLNLSTPPHPVINDQSLMCQTRELSTGNVTSNTKLMQIKSYTLEGITFYGAVIINPSELINLSNKSHSLSVLIWKCSHICRYPSEKLLHKEIKDIMLIRWITSNE